MTAPTLDAPTLAAAVAVLRDVPRSSYGTVSDDALLSLVELAGEARHLADAHLALAAGELDRRSSHELGAAGLARRAGARTPEELLTRVTGARGRDVVTAVRVGRLTQVDSVLGDAVLDGSVSVPAADAIRAGLDGAAADPRLVDEATVLLCEEASTLDPDRLLKRAREVRDELDEAGIAGREAVLRGRRSIRRIDLRDGMKRIIWDYDPLTAGIVDEIYDRATSPRRGGPRFVDSAAAARASRIAEDERTVEQLASDAFAELLRQAASLDSDVLVGRGTPAVRVIVPLDDLTSGSGHGLIEGSGEAIALTTVEALACAHGTQKASLDPDGRVLDLGREQRLYSARQRVALAIRDGGCLWEGCDRPPSWTEAHHIDRWTDGGRTDLDRGVLLCRHHHLRLHNEGWVIRLRAGRYWLELPSGTGRPPTLLVSKSRAIREHVARAGRSPGRRPAITEHPPPKIRA
ncbi:DUF222 domain-containing protein [Pseudolysinimonas sp.]|uniref:HNH endonuclease signature motif containing protein n=1 Tax=Pseudolysinimonas sp. TaxID=2680009 RepID=UPI0037840B1D